MADDKPGDDLFEDLDKFFAPIKDVDWDEPDEPSPGPPREEHVAVRETQDPVNVGSAPQEPAAADENDWYDAGPSSIDEILEEEPMDERSQVDDVRIVEDAPQPGSDQTDLFASGGSDGPDEPIGGGFWEQGDEAVEQPTAVAGEPTGGPQPGAGEEEPSEADLEAAAEHFSGAVRGDRYDTEPVGYERDESEGGQSSGADLLTDLGADEVEQDILSDLEERDHPTAVIVGTEGTSGPSWQEPASVEVGADLDRRGPDGGERDVPAAFLTGTILAGAAVASLLISPAAFAVIATIIVLAAQGELFGVMVRARHQPATAVGLVTGALIMIGSYYRGVEAIPAMVALGVIATFLWYMTVPAMQRKNILQDTGLTVLNLAWIPVFAAYLIALAKGPEGTALVLAVIGLTYVYDTAAFLAGTVAGGAWFRRGMAPATSPKKSWEGFLVATIVTVFISVALVTSFVAPLNDRRIDTILLGLVIAIAATLGDLAESLIKRDLDVKDMSTVLPGHGGVLDRIDSLLFTAPAAYLLLGALDVI